MKARHHHEKETRSVNSGSLDARYLRNLFSYCGARGGCGPSCGSNGAIVS